MFTLSTPAAPALHSGMTRPTPSSDSRPYHHGDLRSALIRSALDLLRSEGLEALTLRGVARAAGVSQAAPYRHFADRRALVAAVAEEGFRRLQEEMVAAYRANPGPAGFKQIALAYVRFARENPAEYRVMFGPEVAQQDDLPALRQTSHGVLDFTRQGIEGLQHAGMIGPGDPWRMAVACWAMLHGLAMLFLDGQTQGVESSPDELLETATRMLMFGMAVRREGSGPIP